MGTSRPKYLLYGYMEPLGPYRTYLCKSPYYDFLICKSLKKVDIRL